MRLLPCLILICVPCAARAADPLPPFAVKVVGVGRPMLLIPGLGCSGAVWDATVEHYKSKYECHVLTLAGFAGQPPLPAGPFLDTVRDGVISYVRTKKLDKPVVIGHSLGGYMVCALGSREPDLFGPLVAVDGVPCLPALYNESATAEQLTAQGEAVAKMIGAAPRDEFLKGHRRTAAGMVADPKRVDEIIQWAGASDQATFARAIGELFSRDLRGEMGKVRSPLLVIAAHSKDMDATGMTRDVVAKRYEAQVAKAPNHKVVVAEGAKHFVMYDAPDWMLAQIDAFLAGK